MPLQTAEFVFCFFFCPITFKFNSDWFARGPTQIEVVRVSYPEGRLEYFGIKRTYAERDRDIERKRERKKNPESVDHYINRKCNKLQELDFLEMLYPSQYERL